MTNRHLDVYTEGRIQQGNKGDKGNEKRILVGLTVVFSGMAAYAGLVNDARFVNQDWAVDMRIEMARLDGSSTNRVGFNVDTGENGQAPSVSDGTLKVTMEGATGGMTQLKSVGLGTYAFHAATNYVVTTRMRVTQFPDDDFDPTVAQSLIGNQRYGYPWVRPDLDRAATGRGVGQWRGS